VSDNIKVGTRVKWRSVSGHYCYGSTEKDGVVVAIIPEGVRPVSYPEKRPLYYPERFDYGDYTLAKLGGGSSRKHESYLVRVDREGSGKPFLYWPRVSLLRTDLLNTI